MAFLYKQKKSNRWTIGYRVNGKLIRESTGTTDRAKAEKKLAEVRSMFEANKARKPLKRLYELLSGEEVDRTTLKQAVNDWITATKDTMAESTHTKYKSLLDRLLKFLKANDSAPLLSEVKTDPVRSFLISEKKKRKASTVNVYAKVLGVFFKWAKDNGLIAESPMGPIKSFKEETKAIATRRAFTAEEIQAMFKKAPSDFWRYMIMAGTYTGLRMGDLITLPWGAVDLKARRLTVYARKTGKRVIVPIRGELHAILTDLRARVKRPSGSDPIWPEQADRYQRNKSGSATFSNEFYDEILAPCGLAPARSSKKKAKDGREVKRDTGNLSFHCLRHSFISFLKATGGNQAVAKELAGHSSDLVSDAYTHLPDDVLEAAIKQLPEVAG